MISDTFRGVNVETESNPPGTGIRPSSLCLHQRGDSLVSKLFHWVRNNHGQCPVDQGRTGIVEKFIANGDKVITPRRVAKCSDCSCDSTTRNNETA